MRRAIAYVALWAVGTVLSLLVVAAATNPVLVEDPALHGHLTGLLITVGATVLVAGALLFVAMDQYVRTLIEESGEA